MKMKMILTGSRLFSSVGVKEKLRRREQIQTHEEG